jgi:hypothetical protein
MFAVILALVIGSTKKTKVLLKGSINRTPKALFPLADPVNLDGCYDTYQALVERYVEDLDGTKRIVTTDGSQKSHLKTKKMVLKAEKTTLELIGEFEAKCLATIEDEDCDGLLTLLKATDAEPSNENKGKFAATCKVDAPPAGGDGSGDIGLFSISVSKVMMLISLASTIIYFHF